MTDSTNALPTGAASTTATAATPRPAAGAPAKNVRSLRGLLPFLRPYRGRIALAIVFLVLAAVSTLVFPVALKSLPRGCDAALTLISGFPQSAVEAGVYPKTARFWFTTELNSSWPVLLRIDADSGLGHLHMDFVSAD